MSLKLELSEEEKGKILALVEDCYFSIIRGVPEDTECAALYVDAASGKSFESVQEVEFACVDDLFRQVFDGFLAHAVKAREYAYMNVTVMERMMARDASRVAQWLDRLGAYPYSPERIRFRGDADPIDLIEITSEEPTKIKPSVLRKTKRLLEERLRSLKVACLSVPKIDIRTGLYNRDANQILVWPFAQILSGGKSWNISDPSTQTYAALVGHTFLHELAHFLESCEGEVLSVLRKRLADQGLTSKWDTWEIAEFMKDNFDVISGYYGHCNRFRFALLYLAYKQKFIRKSMFDQIEAHLKESPSFWKDPGERAFNKDGSPKVAGKYRKAVWVRQPSWGIHEVDLSDEEARRVATYSWEDDIREELKNKQEGKRPLYVPKSIVESVADLKERLLELDSVERRLRGNFMRGTQEDMISAMGSGVLEGILVSPQGFTNLYLADFEDPFEIALEMARSPRVRPLDSVRVDLDLPFIGLQIDQYSIVPVYCDGAGEIYTLTFEEFWWVLAA